MDDNSGDEIDYVSDTDTEPIGDNYDDEIDYVDFDEYDDDTSDTSDISEPSHIPEQPFYELVPTDLRDYHPTWKKSEKTFLDVYIVAKKTRELLHFVREKIDCNIEDFDKKMEILTKDLKTIQAISKRKSTAMLSKLISLPDLIIDMIFSNIVGSYNCHFDRFGPEEMPWQYEDQDIENVAAVCYSATSKFYEKILGRDTGHTLTYLYNMIDWACWGWIHRGDCVHCGDGAHVQRSYQFELVIIMLSNDRSHQVAKCLDTCSDWPRVTCGGVRTSPPGTFRILGRMRWIKHSIMGICEKCGKIDNAENFEEMGKKLFCCNKVEIINYLVIA